MESHRVLNVLDNPPKFLIWSMDEAAFLVGVPFVGILLKHQIISFFIAAAGYFLLRKFKKGGSRDLKSLTYWYFLPYKKVPFCPPSYKRIWLG